MLHYETICKTDLYMSEDLHFSFINLVFAGTKLKKTKQPKVASEFAVTMATSEIVPTQNGCQMISIKFEEKSEDFSS